MASTTVGIKVDDETRARLAALAEAKERSPHWVLRRALFEYLDREERRECERREDAARWEQYVLTGEFVSDARAQEWLEALASGRDAPCPR